MSPDLDANPDSVTRSQGAGRPDGGALVDLQVRRQAGQPRQQAAVTRSSWSGPGWPAPPALANAGRARLQGQGLHLPRLARRAHSIAAAGGINAAKNYRGDGDSIYRLLIDTVKGGDFRSRESNVYRLAEVSGNIIDQCVAQGVPFAREYGPAGQPLVRRLAGLADLLRPWPDGPAAPARCLPGAGPAGRPRQRRTLHPLRADRHRGGRRALLRHRRA